MTHQEIRQKFLEFFEKRNHKIVSSSSLIPDDPSVLFTTAGMQQFKKYYLDADSPYGNRAASIQKCIRTTDIDEVGDESHLTFFEMLGNFSFKFPEGEDSYFREGAIKYSYDLIINDLRVSLERIGISVFKGDEKNNIPADRESLEAWKALGIPDEKIFFGDRKENFWGPTGDEGPCGPTTEIHIDGIEVWNIVFNDYYCDREKHMVPLQRKGVDTGMGLERLVMAMQDKKSVFETDLFLPLITELRGKNLYDYEANKRAERIITDHLKSSAFIISDGVMPSNTDKGYVLRRLIRKIMRYSKKLNLPEDFLERSLKTLINIYKEYYPELKKNRDRIFKTFNEEFQKFGRALDKGLKEFEKIKQSVIKNKEKIISASDIFNLYQNFGFPAEFTKEIASENGLEADLKGFSEYLEKHKKASRAGSENKFK